MSWESNVPNWASVQTAGGERALPVYLLLDTSSSMEGTSIESVRQGVEQCQNECVRDQFAREMVKMGIIVFNSDTTLHMNGLVPVIDLQLPPLIASGVTRLDLAFNMLLQSMDRDVTKAVKGGQKGDWKPMVFVLTDGYPTDRNGEPSDDLWIPARDAVVNRPKGQTKPSSIVSVGCGTDVDDAKLKAISTGIALRMHATGAAFVNLFQWLTQSIISSVQPGGNIDDPFANIQPSPDLIRIP